jgi:hypothetical protein
VLELVRALVLVLVLGLVPVLVPVPELVRALVPVPALVLEQERALGQRKRQSIRPPGLLTELKKLSVLFSFFLL